MFARLTAGPVQVAAGNVVGIPCWPVASHPAPGTVLRPLAGPPRPLSQYLTTFHLLVVALDPYTNESAWILDTAGRVLETFASADCRVGWLVAADGDGCRSFLGPWADRFTTFADPDRDLIGQLALGRLPALVALAMDASVIGAAEGWNPTEWQRVTDELARIVRWKGPSLPAPGDPAPYQGTPARG